MKTAIRHLAVVSIWLAASAAGAAQISAENFTLDSSEPWPSVNRDHLGVTEVVTKLGVYNTLDSGVIFNASGVTLSNTYTQDIQIAARAGYQVTGYSLTSFWNNQVSNSYPTVIPDPSLTVNYAGHAAATQTLSLYATSIDGTAIYDRAVQSLTSTQSGGTVTLNSAALSLTAPFQLHVEHSLLVEAYAGLRQRWISRDGYDIVDDTYFQVQAAGSAAVLVLTVYTAPLAAVPEPAQYALLLLGMALLAGALRRQRKLDTSGLFKAA